MIHEDLALQGVWLSVATMFYIRLWFWATGIINFRGSEGEALEMCKWDLGFKHFLVSVTTVASMITTQDMELLSSVPLSSLGHFWFTQGRSIQYLWECAHFPGLYRIQEHRMARMRVVSWSSRAVRRQRIHQGGSDTLEVMTWDLSMMERQQDHHHCCSASRGSWMGPELH